jgi:hypothetical protein
MNDDPDGEEFILDDDYDVDDFVDHGKEGRR